MKRVAHVTRDDCDWTYSRSSGPGGQHRNKTATAVTVRHRASGAVGKASESKSQWQNRQTAWERMARTPEFQRWAKRVAAGDLDIEARVERAVDAQMADRNLKVEVRDGDEWVDER